MNRSLVPWLIAFAVVLAAAWALRVTSPAAPLRGSVTLGGSTFRYTLERTHSGPDDHSVRIETRHTEIQGTLEWKPLSGGKWREVVMQTRGTALVGSIPRQPSGAAVAYRVRLMHVGRELTLPPGDPVVLRFR